MNNKKNQKSLFNKINCVKVMSICKVLRIKSSKVKVINNNNKIKLILHMIKIC